MVPKAVSVGIESAMCPPVEASFSFAPCFTEVGAFEIDSLDSGGGYKH